MNQGMKSLRRPIAGASEPSGHGLKKFDGGAGSNKSLKSAFRTRAQDATDNGAGHVMSQVPSPGPKSTGGERMPCPQA